MIGWSNDLPERVPERSAPVARFKRKGDHPGKVLVIGTHRDSGETVRSYAWAQDRPHLMENRRNQDHISAAHHAQFAALPLVIV